LKVGSSFPLIREDLAKKMAISCAILWNLYMIILQTLWFFCKSIGSGKEGVKGLIIFFEQPQCPFDYTTKLHYNYQTYKGGLKCQRRKESIQGPVQEKEGRITK
jgi:hypothetical protein